MGNREQDACIELAVKFLLLGSLKRELVFSHTCGNESDVGNIDFGLQTERGDKFLYFILFRNFKEFFKSVQPDVRLIEMEFGSKCSILNGQVVHIEKSKLNIADM